MRPITDILRDIRKGRVVEEATLQLAEVVRRVQFTGKPGELTIKLKVKPPKPGDNLLTIVPEINGKAPRAELPVAMFFADEHGSLLREDPTQTRMFAGVGDGETVDEHGEVRAANGD